MTKVSPEISAYMKSLSQKGLKARRKKYGKDIMAKARSMRKSNRIIDKTDKTVV